jgi:hypothetical protein
LENRIAHTSYWRSSPSGDRRGAEDFVSWFRPPQLAKRRMRTFRIRPMEMKEAMIEDPP